MKHILFAAISILLSQTAVATDEKFECTSSLGTIKVSKENVTIGKDVFPFEKELNAETYSVGSIPFMGEERTDCRATTRLATRAPGGEIVILEMGKSHPVGGTKAVRLGAFICSTSTNPAKFGTPYMWRQTVISKNSKGEMVAVTTDVTDGLRRPVFTVDQLKDPKLTLENKDYHAYYDAQVGSKYPRVRVNTDRCDGAGSTLPRREGTSSGEVEVKQ